jgi:hypothetical protein
MEKSASNGISIWFWSRDSPSVPDFVRSGGNGGGSITTEGWGVPDAYFPTNTNCPYSNHFNAHRIIFDLTFCVSLFCMSPEYRVHSSTRETGQEALDPLKPALASITPTVWIVSLI